MNTPCFSSTMRYRARPSARSGGFALLEALVALLLFSIGILGLLGLQARAISTAGDAEDRNRAALIADQCASAMQLLASGVSINGTGANGILTLVNTCQSETWKDRVKNPAQGGLLNGVLTATSTTSSTVVSGGAPLAPVTVGITVTWCPPVRAGATAGTCTAPSKLTTQTTLLVQNQ